MMKWFLFVVITNGSYPIATVIEVPTETECQEKGTDAVKYTAGEAQFYCVEKKTDEQS